MKPQLAILVFLLLVSSAVLTGIDSLCRTERRAQQAVDQALARTIELCEPDRIDTDTIQVYRSFITMNGVRDTAYLTLDMRGEERQLKLTARTGLTFAVLWALSDQRASGALSVVASRFPVLVRRSRTAKFSDLTGLSSASMPAVARCTSRRCSRH